jgi:predicted secreted Zn-dependent protease
MVHRQSESLPKLWPLVTFCLVLVIALCVIFRLNPLAKAAHDELGRMAATEVQSPPLQASDPASTDAGPESLDLPPVPDAVPEVPNLAPVPDDAPESLNLPPSPDVSPESPSLPPALDPGPARPTLPPAPAAVPPGQEKPVAPPPVASAQVAPAPQPCRRAVRRSPSAPSKQSQVFKSARVTVTVTVERKTFLVQGCTEGELAIAAVKNIPDSAKKNTPGLRWDGDALGLTVQSLSYEWSLDAKGSSCMIASASIVIAIVVHIPEATTREGMSSVESKKWDLLVSKIKTHEQRHVDIFLQGAKSLPQALEAVRVSSKCGDVDKSIQAAMKKIATETDRRNKNFDVQDGLMHVEY